MKYVIVFASVLLTILITAFKQDSTSTLLSILIYSACNKTKLLLTTLAFGITPQKLGCIFHVCQLALRKIP